MERGKRITAKPIDDAWIEARDDMLTPDYVGDVFKQMKTEEILERLSPQALRDFDGDELTPSLSLEETLKKLEEGKLTINEVRASQGFSPINNGFDTSYRIGVLHMSVYLVTANTYLDDKYGEYIHCFGIATSEEELRRITAEVVRRGFKPEIKIISTNTIVDEMLGGYAG